MSEKHIEEGLTFDDLLLIPSFSEVLPSEVEVSTYLTPAIKLNIPLISAAMDTVTEAKTAICMAQEGGLGIIHRNLGVEEQAQEVEKVKKSESGMIVDPIVISPDQQIKDVLELMARYRISGIPVTRGRKLVGIITNRDLRFETNLEQKVEDVMTKENLVTVEEGISLEESKRVLHRHKIEKLLVVDKEYNLKGLITIKDIEKVIKYPTACKDSLGRLRVGAAVGTGTGQGGPGRCPGQSGVRRHRRGHCPRPFEERDRIDSSRQGRLPVAPDHRGEHRHRRGVPRPHRRRVRRGEDRGGARLHLHHEDRGRHRGPPDHRHPRGRQGGEEAGRSGDRRRRHQVLGRHHQGHSSRGRRGHDRQPFCGNRRDPGGDGALPGHGRTRCTGAWAPSMP